MRELFSLDARLSLCAEFVRENSRVADIGTDHAYLPVHLVLKGKVSSAIAADIAPEPLKKGSETIEKYMLSDKIEARLSEGLCEIDKCEVDDIVIAGMGGDTIISILDDAPWVKDSDISLIIQPMTKVHRVIRYLYKEGFEIKKQSTCTASGKLYTVMAVSYVGVPRNVSSEFSYTGILCPEKNDMDRLYLKHQVEVLYKRARGDIKYREIADKISERISHL